MAINDFLLLTFIKNKLRGKDRLYSLIVKMGFRKLIYVKAKYGIGLYLNPHEYIDDIIIKEGFYESEITDAILANVNDDDVFWDIGANIGIHGIAVKKCKPNTLVYSFEPNPKTLSLLFDNIKVNELNITVCGFALFDEEKQMTLHITEGNSGMTTLTPWHEIEFTDSIKCLTTTGDKVVSSGFLVPTIMKLDTEGSELNVLKGCRNLLNNPILRKIIFEAGNDLLSRIDTDEITLFLARHGFTHLERLSRNEDTAHGLSNFIASKSI